MEQIYAWAEHNAIMASAIGFVLAIALTAIPNTAIMKVAFTVSQFIRKVLGEKVEAAIEEKGQAFIDGMKGDNKKK